MKKKIGLLGMVFLIVIQMLIPCSVSFAFDADEHDSYMSQVLFGDEAFADSKSTKIQNYVKMFEYASYLSIDQFNGNGQDKLTFLKKQKVKGLPKLSEIDFTSNSTHRSYTHRGWNFTYVVQKGQKTDKANWSARKNILRSTANCVFDFGFFNELFGKYCDKNDAFCELIYYVHILGDHLEADKYTVEDLIIPCARANYSESNPDIFGDLSAAFTVLFSDQKDSLTYSSLTSEMDTLAEKARTLAGTTGGINTDEKFEEYHQYEEDLMDLLIAYVPLLLKEEDFFSEVFY